MSAVAIRAGLVLLLLGLTTATVWLVAAPAALREAEPQTAIRQLLQAQVVAWNKGALEDFMAGYWNSADLSFSSGKDNLRGWQTTLDRYRKRYQAEGKEMGRLTFTDLEIDPLSSDTAFVRGRWQVVTSKETLSGLFTLILKRLNEGWRIVHDHTSS
jgi:beta-aspartyl-peptidase (threonine type)